MSLTWTLVRDFKWDLSTSRGLPTHSVLKKTFAVVYFKHHIYVCVSLSIEICGTYYMYGDRKRNAHHILVEKLHGKQPYVEDGILVK